VQVFNESLYWVREEMFLQIADKDLLDFWHGTISVTYHWKCVHFIKHFKIYLNDIGAFNQIWKWVKIKNIFDIFYLFIIKEEKKHCIGQRKSLSCLWRGSGLIRQTATNWFRRFRDGNFDAKDAFRSGQPITKNWRKLSCEQLWHS